MIISNSSPLIVLGRIERLDILESLFGKIYIPNAVFRETVLETTFEVQNTSILHAIAKETLIVIVPTLTHSFTRKLHSGESDVLRLALEKNATGIILDDKKARKEAVQLGMQHALIYTTDILKWAEKRGLIKSYSNVMEHLKTMNLHLPE